jgi:fatty acid desaturase
MKEERLNELNSSYRHLLKANDLKAWTVTLSVLATSSIGIMLSLSEGVVFWLCGQVVLGISMLQWFFLVHDYGHGNYFSSKGLNDFWGHVASFFCILPFYPWRYIHRGHHYWTGWKDKDPTMTVIIPRDLPPGKKNFINWCWRLWIPIFSVSFSLSNFWNMKKLKELYPGKEGKFLFSILFLIGSYLLLVTVVPPFFKVWGFAYFIFLFLSDPLLLSQHSSVPQNHTRGKKVKPISFREQDVYTRSLIFPSFVTKYILLSFNNHIVHHIYPTMPGYNLYKVNERFANEEPWFSWLIRAKGTPAVELLFSEERNISSSSELDKNTSESFT